jgi:uncharacterized protein YaaR (DUF327 family)
MKKQRIPYGHYFKWIEHHSNILNRKKVIKDIKDYKKVIKAVKGNVAMKAMKAKKA